MKKVIKTSKIVSAIALIACLFIKYASFKYFSIPLDYHIYEVSILRELLVLTAVAIFVEVFGKVKWINTYVVMILTTLTMFSWIDFYKDYKVIKIVDVTSEVININCNNFIFVVAIVLVITFVVYFIDVVLKKSKSN